MQSQWTFYLNGMANLFTLQLLALAVIGVFVGLRDEHLRKEVIVAIIWIIVCYFGFSYIMTRELRYILLIIPPIVILSIIGFISILHWTAAWLNKDPDYFFIVGMAAILMIHVSTAPRIWVSRVSGFQEVVAFFEKEAPGERIFYDGNYNGNFSFYMLSKDRHFKRGVVLGHKLLYASTITPTFNLVERVSSPNEVIEVLRKEGGCKWVAIERWGVSDQVAAARLLRQASAGPEFEFVRAFPIMARRVTWVDVYRFLPPIEKKDDIDLRFPGFGKDVVFQAKPIEESSEDNKK